MLRRVILTVLPCCFLFTLFVPTAKADVIERVQAEATGILPASATLTISEPSAGAGLARVCITSRSAGELLCVTI